MPALNAPCTPPIGKPRPQDRARRSGWVGNPNGVLDGPPPRADEEKREREEDERACWEAKRWTLHREASELLAGERDPESPTWVPVAQVKAPQRSAVNDPNVLMIAVAIALLLAE